MSHFNKLYLRNQSDPGFTPYFTSGIILQRVNLQVQIWAGFFIFCLKIDGKYLRSNPVYVLPKLKPQFNLILTKTMKYALKKEGRNTFRKFTSICMIYLASDLCRLPVICDLL